MESIVATVSGYHGSERFKLIKLISLAGANYVGAMTRSTTHLVCWKFEGKKYDLAKKFGTVIVNHQWLEDCMKAGKRIPELPYTKQSGYEVGSITLEVPSLVKKVEAGKKNWLPLNESNERDDFRYPVIDVESEEIEYECLHGDWLLDEKLFSQQVENSSASSRSKKRAAKKALKQDKWVNSRCEVLQTQRSASDKLQHRKGDHDGSKYTSVAEPSCIRRCFRKENANRDLNKSSHCILESECGTPFEPELLQNAAGVSSHLEDLHSENEVRVISRSEDAFTHNGSMAYGNMTEKWITDRKDLHAFSHSCLYNGEAPAARERTLQEISPDIDKPKGMLKNCDQTNHPDSLSTSPEVSCAICWTEYCSTRGVLPCGHRFCFSCIQSWADHMVSNGKISACPMCKASFASIRKVDDAACLDQKIYSQTIPCASTAEDIVILPDCELRRSGTQMPIMPACCHCHSPEPEDLLIHCHACRMQCIHSYCLDPPLFPWICVNCKDRRMLYHHIRY